LIINDGGYFGILITSTNIFLFHGSIFLTIFFVIIQPRLLFSQFIFRDFLTFLVNSDKAQQDPEP